MALGRKSYVKLFQDVRISLDTGLQVHGILVHTSDGRPKTARGSTHYRYPVLHEVRWGADFQSIITRKLINETHGNVMIVIVYNSCFGIAKEAAIMLSLEYFFSIGFEPIFMDLQHVPDTGGTEKKASLIKFQSRRYRSVVRACILDLEEKSDPRESSGVFKDIRSQLFHRWCGLEQRQLLTLIETVWHLCEILFIETLPGGAVLHHLLEWVQNGHTDKYVKDVLQHPQPHDSPSYWPAIYSLVLQGRVNDVRELLAQHPGRQIGEYDEFASMDELLRKMPMYQLYMGQSLAEFSMKWSHWQHECKHRLANETYAGNPHLRKYVRYSVYAYPGLH
ncbi:Nucleoporin nup85 [Desmophyllum pertusum]|uniref:Nuclear pore complex protein Nup85 n=1 Tax=Desmophyllum pertusum TaxID=174260 RepID=A0A9X0CL52_9CNID|nr:Nucleoporin nup85 [Desmophyllum pertusum]